VADARSRREVDRRGRLVLVTTGMPCVVDAGNLVSEGLSTSSGVTSPTATGEVLLTPVPTSTQRRDGPEIIETDPEVAALEPACPCCEVRIDLLMHLVRLARRQHPPRRAVVLLSEADDPATAIQTVLGDAELRRTWRLDSLIHLAGSDDVLADDRPALAAAIALADRVVDPVRGLTTALRAECGSWSIEGTSRRLLHPTGDRLVVGPGAIQHLTMSLPGELEPELLLDWFHELHHHHGPDLLRLDASLRVADSPQRWVAVGTRSTMELADDAASIHDAGPSVVRLVGRELDPVHLHDQLLECLVGRV